MSLARPPSSTLMSLEYIVCAADTVLSHYVVMTMYVVARPSSENPKAGSTENHPIVRSIAGIGQPLFYADFVPLVFDESIARFHWNKLQKRAKAKNKCVSNQMLEYV